MILTKEQTYQILYLRRKHSAISNKYKFTSKTRWYCLHCLREIFVSFEQAGRYSIFCPACYNYFQTKETIAQAHYLRVLKEKQLSILDNFQKRVTTRINKLKSNKNAIGSK